MNKNIAIKVENLSKRYRIGAKEERADTLIGGITSWIKSPFSNFRQLQKLSKFGAKDDGEDILWALKDVSFDVKQGEVVGIIGRNGAGKSTLLKILSRITEPTSGKITLNGRVSSLLEVGTGFHPELTGRENIYLNGTVLGMSKIEIDQKFDEIVAFSEVEKFLDTPVKRYSSGMKVRLAFAVAAHLEPEILMVDEVLAVGDIAFQKKCLSKMEDVAGEGRTVLFVSHNMVAMQNLCEKVIWLDNGKIIEEGYSGQVVPNYLHNSAGDLKLTRQVWNNIEEAPGNEEVRLHSVSIFPETKSRSGLITMETAIVMKIEYWNFEQDAKIGLNFHLLTEDGSIAFAAGTVDEPVWHGKPFPVGLFRSKCYVPGNLLNSGFHRIRLQVMKEERLIHVLESALTFEIHDTRKRNSSWYGKARGAVRPVLKWSTEMIKDNTNPVFHEHL